MMATARKTHVKTSVELLGDDQEPHHDSSDQSDVDDGSVEGDNGVDDLNGDHSGDAAESDGEDADDEDKGNGDDDGEPEANPNAGWADAMSKILQKKTPTGKSTILLKNKQLEKIKEKEKQEKLEQRQKTDKRRAWEMMCRVKPDVVKDRDYERTFQRTATRGVVQLFNAVRKHQNLVNDKVKEVGGSDRKKAKLLSSVTKKDFIDVLRGKDENRKAAVKNEKETHADGEDEKPSWSVLRDDFMMGASMKDWDKESDGEEGQSKTDKVAEDSDSD